MKNINWEKHILWLSFALPVGIMLIIFAAAGVYPFGGRSFLYSDMYHQYMPFFREFKNLVAEGAGLDYSWRIGLGGNFQVLFIYYLASPLNWLAFLTPDRFLMEFMTYLVVARIGLAGLGFCWYLKKHFERPHLLMSFFACFYALSGFMAAYNWNIMWLDCVALLPLLVFFLEELTEGRGGVAYCLLLGLCIFTNFYLSIMICIFLVLYFALLLFTKRGWSGRTILRFGLYSLLAGGLAAILLVPEVVTILRTDFADSSFPREIKSYFSILEVVARHCMLTEPERGLDHWPNIYCGSGVLLLLPVYVMHQGISAGKRMGYLALAGFFLASFSTNALDFVWHGWNYPNSLPARQSFIYIFLILTMAYEVWDKRETLQKQYLVYGCVMAGAFLLFCERYADREQIPAGGIWATMGIVLALGALFYLSLLCPQGKRRMWLGLSACLLLGVEAGINTGVTSVGTTDRAAYLEAAEEERSLALLAEEDRKERGAEGLYRVEKFSRRTKNDGALGGYPTASLFASTLNSHIADLYEKLGMRHSKVYYSFDGATPLIAAMLNVEYMIGEEGEYENLLYEKIGEEGERTLHRCRYRLPFGYVIPADLEIEAGQNGLELQNELVSSLGVEGILFEELGSEKGESVTVTAEEAGVYYGRLLTGNIKKVEVIRGEFRQTCSDLKRGGILYLGELAEGESLTVEGADAEEEEEAQELQLAIYRMNESVLEQALRTMGASPMESVEIGRARIQGKIQMRQEGKLVLSVPAENGWSLWVDGEKGEYEALGEALMAIRLEEGDHEILLSYHVPGKTAGRIVTAVSLAILAGVTVAKRKASFSK